jgi:hypothetical protein
VNVFIAADRGRGRHRHLAQLAGNMSRVHVDAAFPIPIRMAISMAISIPGLRSYTERGMWNVEDGT